MGIVEKILTQWNGARAAAGLETQPAAETPAESPDTPKLEERSTAETLGAEMEYRPSFPKLEERSTAETPVQNTAAQTPAASWPKPETMSQEDYDYLTGQGFSPEGIARAYKPYDPASGGYLQRIYEMSVKKPEYDEKTARRRQQTAFLGDSLRLLGEMWAADKGAYVGRRNPDEFLHSQERKLQYQLEDRYRRALQTWQNGLANAAWKDYNAGLGSHERNRKAIRDTLDGKRDMEYKASEAQRKQQNEDRNYELRQQNAGDARRHREVMERQGWSRLSGAGRSNSSAGGGKKEQGTRIAYRAVPNDPEAVTDPQTGEKVRTRTLPYGLDYIVQEALADEELLNEHPEWRVYTNGGKQDNPDIPDILRSSGKPSTPVTPTEDIKRRIVEAYFRKKDNQLYNSDKSAETVPEKATETVPDKAAETVPDKYSAEEMESWADPAETEKLNNSLVR